MTVSSYAADILVNPVFHSSDNTCAGERKRNLKIDEARTEQTNSILRRRGHYGVSSIRNIWTSPKIHDTTNSRLPERTPSVSWKSRQITSQNEIVPCFLKIKPLCAIGCGPRNVQMDGAICSINARRSREILTVSDNVTHRHHREQEQPRPRPAQPPHRWRCEYRPQPAR